MKESRLLQIAILFMSFVLLIAGLGIYGLFRHTDVSNDIVYNRTTLRSGGVVSAATQNAWKAINISEQDVEENYFYEEVEEPVNNNSVMETAQLSDFELLWSTRVIADVKDYVTVRQNPDKSSEAVGKLKKGDLATYISEEDGWYYITSGNLTGYVSKQYAYRGDEAYSIALKTCNVYATTVGSGLRIRKSASTDSAVVKSVPKGTKLIYIAEDNPAEGWIHVRSGAVTGYVSADYVSVDFDFGKAETAAEEGARIAKEKEAKEKAKRLAAEKAAQTEALIASVDDLMLLAALIHIEAGAEPYEGQVAVGAVVMNRVKSKTYPNTIKEVIYQKSQFSTARIPTILSNGPLDSCIKAAREAMDGKDPTGGCIGFKAKSTGQKGYVIGKQVFF